MARSFNGINQYLSRAAVATSVPITMACVFRAIDTSSRCLIGVFQNAATGAYMAIYLSGGAVVAEAFDGVATVGTSSLAGVSTNTLHHAAAVFTNNASRTAYLDGVAGTPNTTLVAPTGIDTTAIGAVVRPTPVFLMNGSIAEAAIWDVDLTDRELVALGKRWDPRKIRPHSLVAYWRLQGDASPEPDGWKKRAQSDLNQRSREGRSPADDLRAMRRTAEES